MKPDWYLLGLVCAGTVMAPPLSAAENAVDAEFLEYLGTVDSNEAGWHEYLATTDVDKVGKRATTPASNPPTTAPPSKPAAPADTPPALNVPRKVKQS